MAQPNKIDQDRIPDSIFRYAWQFTKRQQLWVLAIVLLSMPTYFLSLDLPKQIVNGPIQGRGFDSPDATGKLLNITLSLPDWLYSGPPVELFPGFTLDRTGMLIGLSMLFLALVMVNGLFKFYINTYKGRLGERVLRRLRYQLVDRVMRFPLPQFRRVKPAEIASMIKDEVDPIGGFVGDAFVTPMFVGGQALTALIFIMVQNVWLGLIAFSIILLQGIVIPRLRRRLIDLSRQRQLASREFAGRLGELVDGIANVHTNDTSNFERAEASLRLGHLFAIRYELFQRKFFVKFLNNLLAQFTPFLFYLVGGYLALTNRLDIGQLVAVIAAYKDLPGPIKDLIDWDQQRLTIEVKYAQVTEQFNVDAMLDSELQALNFEPVEPIKAGLEMSSAMMENDSASRLFDKVSFKVKPGQKVALLGNHGSGVDAVAESLARLHPLDAGQIKLDGHNISQMSESITGRRIAYVPADMSLMSGKVADNILYMVKYAPTDVPSEDKVKGNAQLKWQLQEARATGNSELAYANDWISYRDIGLSGPEQLRPALHQVLEQVDLAQDLLELGLRGVIDPQLKPELVARILAARTKLREKLSTSEFSHTVEIFDPQRFTTQATIAENLLFGTPIGSEFNMDNLAQQPFMRQILAVGKLDEALFEMGREIAETTIELFADLPPDHPFFEQLSFMTAAQIPDYKKILARVQGGSFTDASDNCRTSLIQLPMAYIEPRHRLGLIDEDLQARLLAARQRFAAELPGKFSGAVAFYDPDTYNPAADIQDNILFGRIAYGIAGAQTAVIEEARSISQQFDLQVDIMDVGLEFDVGTAGKRLSKAQRQKVALAGALLKNADILILNRILQALDRQAQTTIINRLLERKSDTRPAIVAVLNNPGLAEKFDTIIVMDKGKIIETGSHAELLRKSGAYAKLVGGN